MSVRSKWMFILIGDNNTGKTTVQKVLVELLNGGQYKRLPSNVSHDLMPPFFFLGKCRKVFVAGRSYQELKGKPPDKIYTSVKEYFENRLDVAEPNVDVGFMASHLSPSDIDEMLREAHRRFWNVCGIFFSNSISIHGPQNAEISALLWDERWFVENPRTDHAETQDRQLRKVAETIVEMFIERARGW
jgi:hypothetical protein